MIALQRKIFPDVFLGVGMIFRLRGGHDGEPVAPRKERNMEREFMGFSIVWDFGSEIRIMADGRVIEERRLDIVGPRNAAHMIGEIQEDMVRDATAMEIR